MKLRNFKIISAILLIFITTSCTSTKVQTDIPRADKLFMWELKTDTASVWFLGSVHIADSSLYPMHKKITDAFNSSENLVVEANISGSNMMKIQSLTFSRGFLKDGKTLKSELRPELYKKAETCLKNLGSDIKSMSTMKPWLAAITISTLKMLRSGLNPELGIDKHFLKLAEKQNKKILELESADFQINMLTNFTAEQQLAFLESAVDDKTSTGESVKKILSFWKKGDVTGMYKMIFTKTDKESDLEIRDKMFFKRNISMAGKIEEMVKKGGSYFIVVGSGHLCGPGSIVDILRKKNYKLLRTNK